MLETRSAVYKMLRPVANEERRITNWPPPFSGSMTPYKEREFNNLVRQACASASTAPRIAKVIVLGDVAVGKTSLVNRFCHKKFDNNYKATIGVDFEVERFDVLGVPFNLQIWDTAGQERFKCIAASYYRGANVIMIVFDLGSLFTLSHSKQWLEEAMKSNNGPCHVFLVGTKKDLLSNQLYEIIERRAMAVAEGIKAEYWAVSAKTGDGIDQLFSRISALSFEATVLREIRSSRTEPLPLGSDLINLKRQPEVEKTQKRLFKFLKCSP
ncbi:ras-related protein Rab-34 [Fopius arisanus]|uniref:Ras-related protein Rab-36 n=1 Tax=Fopius arisanus TaxID=64838 RepID=A0A0C9QFF3_9HYME|nr:PREDICTED: ras-related protein Rab-34 [Fopius arisanus]